MAISSLNAAVKDCGDYGGFKYEIYNPESATATVKIFIPMGETMKAIPGCMVATSHNIEIKGKLKKTFKAMVGPDDARHQTFTAHESDGWVVLAPAFFGAIRAIALNGEEVCVGDDCYLASFGEVESTSVRQGAKRAMFSGQGLFVKKVKGTGILLVQAVGSIMSMDLQDGEVVIIDNGHLVTWPRDVMYEVQKAAKGWFKTGLSGEGMVMKFSGPCRVYMQTRNPEEVAEWIYETKRPPCPNGGGAA